MLTGWIAYFELEPFGDEWRQAGTIAAELSYVASCILAGSGIKSDVRTPDSFLPVQTEHTERSSQKRRLTDAEAHYSFLVGFGFL